MWSEVNNVGFELLRHPLGFFFGAFQIQMNEH